MSLYRALLLALFVVGGAVTAGVAAGATVHDGAERVADDIADRDGAVRSGGAVPADVDSVDVRSGADARTGAAQDAANNSSGGSSLGADISAFMQASASEVDGAVETGMWGAAYNDTENRSERVQLVERRTEELNSTLAELRERKAELVAERAAGNVSEAAYKAKLSGLIGRINALESAIDATADRAEEVGAAPEALGTLRTATANLSGPELATVARNLTGVGTTPVAPGNGRAGPPNGERPGADAANGTATGNGLGPGNGTDGSGDADGDRPGVGSGNAGGDAGGANGAGEAAGDGNGTDLGNGNNAGGNGGGGNGGANVSGGGPGNDGAPTSAVDGVRSAGTPVDGAAETVLATVTATPGLFGHVATALEAPAVAPVGGR